MFACLILNLMRYVHTGRKQKLSFLFNFQKFLGDIDIFIFTILARRSLLITRFRERLIYSIITKLSCYRVSNVRNN